MPPSIPRSGSTYPTLSSSPQISSKPNAASKVTAGTNGNLQSVSAVGDAGNIIDFDLTAKHHHPSIKLRQEKRQQNERIGCGNLLHGSSTSATLPYSISNPLPHKSSSGQNNLLRPPFINYKDPLTPTRSNYSSTRSSVPISDDTMTRQLLPSLVTEDTDYNERKGSSDEYIDRLEKLGSKTSKIGGNLKELVANDASTNVGEVNISRKGNVMSNPDSSSSGNRLMAPYNNFIDNNIGGNGGSFAPSSLYNPGSGQFGIGAGFLGATGYPSSSLLINNGMGGYGYGGGYGGGMYGFGNGLPSDSGGTGGGINGMIYNINQFLFGVQTIIFSLGQAVHIIGTNTDAVKTLVDAVGTMFDHAVTTWCEVQAIDNASRTNETEHDKKRRRRLRAIRWAVIVIASYTGYNIILRKWLWHYFFANKTKRFSNDRRAQIPIR